VRVLTYWRDAIDQDKRRATLDVSGPNDIAIMYLAKNSRDNFRRRGWPAVQVIWRFHRKGYPMGGAQVPNSAPVGFGDGTGRTRSAENATLRPARDKDGALAADR